MRTVNTYFGHMSRILLGKQPNEGIGMLTGYNHPQIQKPIDCIIATATNMHVNQSAADQLE